MARQVTILLSLFVVAGSSRTIAQALPSAAPIFRYQTDEFWLNLLA